MTSVPFLPAWQDMELASPSPEEPVTQIEADVPVEPLALQADATNLDLDLHASERFLAVTLLGLQKWFLIGKILMPCKHWYLTLDLANGFALT